MPAASSAGPVLAALRTPRAASSGARRDERGRHGDARASAMRSSAQRIDRANASRSPLAASRDISGRIAVCIGCARHGVRREEEHERDLVRDDAAGHAVARRRSPRPATCPRPSAATRPTPRAGQPRERGVTPVPTRAHREAGPARRDHEDADVGDDTAGARDREQKLLRGRQVECRDSGRPATRNATKHTIITTVLPIGAAAVIANRRRA